MAYQSRKKKQEKDLKVRFRVWGVVILLVVIFYAAHYFSRYESQQIKEVQFVGILRADETSLEKDIWYMMETDWWQPIARTHRLLYPKNRIETYVLTNHPLIESLSFQTLKESQVLEVTVVERGPEYVVCDIDQQDVLTHVVQVHNQEESDEIKREEERNHAQDIPCLFVDYEGLAYEWYDTQSQFEGIFISKKNLKTNIPYVIFTQKEKDFFEEIKKYQTAQGTVSLIEYLPDDETRVYFGGDFYIKMIEYLPVQEQIENLELFLGSELATADMTQYTYVDTRFPEKIYFLERGDEPVYEENIEEEALSEPEDITPQEE